MIEAMKLRVDRALVAGPRTVGPAALPARDGSNVFIPLYSGDATK